MKRPPANIPLGGGGVCVVCNIKAIARPQVIQSHRLHISGLCSFPSSPTSRRGDLSWSGRALPLAGPSATAQPETFHPHRL